MEEKPTNKGYYIEPIFSSDPHKKILLYVVMDKYGKSHITGTFKECQKWISDNTFKN
jgi:hypothetical protein